jgi:thiamine biosynthesis protein ThiI
MAISEVAPSSPTLVPGGRQRLLVRLAGELGTKSARTRRRFLATLVANIARALRTAQIPGRVTQEWSRLWIDTADLPAARAAAVHAFGVHSAVEVLEVPFDTLPELVRTIEPLYRSQVRGRTFAVRARRADSSMLDPQDLAVALGTALLPGSAGVNLDQPQVEVQILLGEGLIYACGEQSQGPGGLPLGSGGGALALLSGGFDSPVAAWHVMRRGVRLDLVHFDLGGCGQVEAAGKVARDLARHWAPGTHMAMHVVDLAPLIQALQERCDRRLRQLLLKRAMYRAASHLASDLGAEALVTGEALAQVSTQTLRSLVVCEAAATLPVLRPLAGMDKAEIIERARQIGTYAASEQVEEHCSIAGRKVITWPRAEAVEAAEKLVSEEATATWIAGQVAARRVINLSRWRPAPPANKTVKVETIPPDAAVVDIREPYEGPAVGDLQLPYSIALERSDMLQVGREYVLVCSTGQRSSALAAQLRQRGFSTWSLRGGLRNL